MTVDGAFFSPAFIWLASVVYGLILVVAARLAPWAKFRGQEQLHVFLGAVVVLVAFRPRWVYSFSDELYLKGK